MKKYPKRGSSKTSTHAPAAAPAHTAAAPDTIPRLFLSLLSWLTLFLGLVLFPETPVGAAAAATSAREARFFRLTYMDDRVVDPSSGPMENTLVQQLSEVKSPGQCAAACLSEERCSSFFHDSVGRQCLMHSIVFLGADEASPKAGVTYWQISQDRCSAKEGFVLYRPLGLCYKYYSQQSFWNEANSTCNSAGTPLIKVNSQEVSTHIYQFLRGSSTTRSSHICIGAAKDGGSGVFKWLDGSDVTWFNWATNEPSGGNENCITMAWFFYFKWNDAPCGSNPITKYNFVCQKIL